MIAAAAPTNNVATDRQIRCPSVVNTTVQPTTHTAAGIGVDGTGLAVEAEPCWDRP
jgi:hypothetical protein